MLGRRSRKEARPGAVGIALRDDGMEVVCLLPGDERVRLAVADSLACGDDAADRARALADLVRRHDLAGLPCVLALPNEACAIRLIETPPVPEEERLDAVRWSLAETVDFPVEDAALHVAAEAPAAGNSALGRLVVVAAPGELVRGVVRAAREAGLTPVAVHAEESALAALAPSAGDPKGTAVLELGPKQGRLVIGRTSRLFLARTVAADAAVFANLGPDGDAPDEDARFALEQLSLDVQRSVDFFDAGFGRVPVSRLWIVPGDAEVDGLAPALEQNLGLSVRILDVNEHFASDAPLALGLQPRFAPAIGAARVALDGERGPALLGAVREPPRPRFAARTVARAVAALALALLAVHGVERLQLARALAERGAAESERDGLTARLGELTAQARREGDPALAARIDALRGERAAIEGELAALASSGPATAPRFVGLMEALARHPSEGTWLREIRIGAGGASLALGGASLAPDGVSRLLDSLGANPALAGVRLGALRVTRPDDAPDRVEFRVGEIAAEESP